MAEAMAQNRAILQYFSGILDFNLRSRPATVYLCTAALRIASFQAMHYKFKYDRVRPSRLSPRLNPPIDPPGHAAFPSGHATQARLIARCLEAVMPATIIPIDGVGSQPDQGPLRQMADRIARNREVLGLHYPSDSLRRQASRRRDLRPDGNPGRPVHERHDARERHRAGTGGVGLRQIPFEPGADQQPGGQTGTYPPGRRSAPLPPPLTTSGSRTIPAGVGVKRRGVRAPSVAQPRGRWHSSAALPPPRGSCSAGAKVSYALRFNSTVQTVLRTCPRSGPCTPLSLSQRFEPSSRRDIASAQTAFAKLEAERAVKAGDLELLAAVGMSSEPPRCRRVQRMNESYVSSADHAADGASSRHARRPAPPARLPRTPAARPTSAPA